MISTVMARIANIISTPLGSRLDTLARQHPARSVSQAEQTPTRDSRGCEPTWPRAPAHGLAAFLDITQVRLGHTELPTIRTPPLRSPESGPQSAQQQRFSLLPTRSFCNDADLLFRQHATKRGIVTGHAVIVIEASLSGAPWRSPWRRQHCGAKLARALRVRPRVEEQA